MKAEFTAIIEPVPAEGGYWAICPRRPAPMERARRSKRPRIELQGQLNRYCRIAMADTSAGLPEDAIQDTVRIG